MNLNKADFSGSDLVEADLTGENPRVARTSARRTTGESTRQLAIAAPPKVTR
jgi:hypothetical protein